MSRSYTAWAIRDRNGSLFHDTYSTRKSAIAAFVRNVDREAFAAARGGSVWEKMALGYSESLNPEDVRAWKKQYRMGRRAVRVLVSPLPEEPRT